MTSKSEEAYLNLRKERADGDLTGKIDGGAGMQAPGQGAGVDVRAIRLRQQALRSNQG